MEENSKPNRKKPGRPRYDDKEFMMLLEMVKRGKAYSKVQHYKRCTTGIMFELQKSMVNQSWSVGQA